MSFIVFNKSLNSLMAVDLIIFLEDFLKVFLNFKFFLIFKKIHLFSGKTSIFTIFNKFFSMNSENH